MHGDHLPEFRVGVYLFETGLQKDLRAINKMDYDFANQASSKASVSCPSDSVIVTLSQAMMRLIYLRIIDDDLG